MPWIANLATLAVVVSAIGWSGGQRPDAPPVSAASAVPAAKVQTAPAADRGTVMHPGAHPGRWPVKTPARPINGLQAVGYTPGQTP